jgi:hypothetical protein
VTTIKKLLIISVSKTFPVSKKVADIITFQEWCPHFDQLPSQQTVICDGLHSSFSAIASLAACIVEHSLT